MTVSQIETKGLTGPKGAPGKDGVDGINGLDGLNSEISPINTSNTEPLSNSQIQESSLANVTLDAVKELTGVEIAMVRGSNFIGENSKLSDVNTLCKNTKLYKVDLKLSVIKNLVEKSFQKETFNPIHVSGMNIEFNTDWDSLWRLFVGNDIAWVYMDFQSEEVANLTISPLTTDQLIDPKFRTTKAGYGGSKYTHDSLLSVVVDKELLDSLELSAVPHDIDLQIALKQASNSLRTSESSRILISGESLLLRPDIPVLLTNRINFGPTSTLGFEFLCADGKPFLNSSAKVLKGTGGAGVGIGASGPDIGTIILSKGGNSADAMVAASFLAAVNTSNAGYFGGAGFITIYDKVENKSYTIDCRESLSENCPVQSDTQSWPCPTELVNSAGETVNNPNRAFSMMSTGVTGFFHGLIKLFNDFGSGKFSLSELIEPSVRYLEISPKLSPTEMFSVAGPTVIATNTGPMFDKDDILDSSGYVAKNLVARNSEGVPYLNVTKNNMNVIRPEMLTMYRNIQRYGPEFMTHGSVMANIPVPTWPDQVCGHIQKQLRENKLMDADHVKPYVPVVTDFEKYEAKYRTPAVTKFMHGEDHYEIHTHPAPCASHCAGFGVKLAVASSALVQDNPHHPGTIIRFGMIQVICKDMRGYVAGDYDNWANTSVLTQFATNMAASYNWTPDLTGVTTNAEFNDYLVSDAVIDKFKVYLETFSEWEAAKDLEVPDLTDADYTFVNKSSDHDAELGSTNNFTFTDDKLWIQFNNSVNYIGGSKSLVNGLFINNEVFDFPDIGTYGTNDFGPGRRPASSQAPCIMLKNGKPFYSVGGSGGWRIYIGVMWRLYLAVKGVKADVIESKYNGCPQGSFGSLFVTNSLPQPIVDECNKLMETTTYFSTNYCRYTTPANCNAIMEEEGVYTTVLGTRRMWNSASVVNRV